MRDGLPGVGRLRPNVEVAATGFVPTELTEAACGECFHLAARAGVYRAAVEAAHAEEVLRERRKGVIDQLEAIAKAAQSATQAIAELRSKTNPYVLMPVDQKGTEKVEARLWEQRRKAILHALDDLILGENGCATIEFLASDEIERFDPPRRDTQTWPKTFAQSLAITWINLTGRKPGHRFNDERPLTGFGAFVESAYSTIAENGNTAEAIHDRGGWRYFVLEAYKSLKCSGVLAKVVAAGGHPHPLVCHWPRATHIEVGNVRQALRMTRPNHVDRRFITSAILILKGIGTIPQPERSSQRSSTPQTCAEATASRATRFG